MVTLRLFGGATLESGQSPITGRSAQRRRIAVLALLALARRGLPREKLIGYVWAEHDGEKARRLLSESLYVLRKELGEDAVVASGDELRLNPDVVRCDVLAFEDALENSDFSHAATLYAGPFLDGFYVPDAIELERWIESERDRLARAYHSALERLAEASAADGRGDESIGHWRKLADQDPYSGRYAIGLMQALDSAGHRAAALQHARAHATLLREELDAEPDPAVTALAERLREAPGPSVRSAAGAENGASAEPRTVASAKPTLAEAGTVTFLFTDIEGSTALLRRLGPRYAELLAAHHAIVRARVREHHGREIDNAGDGFCLVFPRARDAVAAAVGIQRDLAAAPWPDGVAVRVRMGIHTGEPALTHQGYVGVDVHRAARICGVASGGRILLSSVTRELVAGDIPSGVSVRDEGVHELKDLERAEHLYAIDVATVEASAARASEPSGSVPSFSSTAEAAPVHLPQRSAPVPESDFEAHGHRKRRLVAWAALGSLVVFGPIALFLPRHDPPASVAEPATTVVAVFPFTVNGADDLDYWGTGVVNLLSMSLDGAAGLRAIDPDALLAEVGARGGPAALTPTTIAEIASALGARLYVRGDVTSVGQGRVRVAARLWDLCRDEQAACEPEGASEPGPAENPISANIEASDLGPIVDSLTTRLVAGWLGGPAQHIARIAVYTSSSWPAVREWLLGEPFFNAARYDSAVVHFQRAVALDPSFAIAHYRLSMAAAYNLDFGLPPRHAALAVEHAGPLPPHYQKLIDAWDHLIHGRADRAAALYRTVRTERPEEIEAAYGMGEAIVHFNPMLGRSTAPARTAFERVLELTDNYGDARFHMLEFAGADGDAATFDSLLALVDTTAEQWLAWRAVQAFGWGRGAAKQDIERRLRSAVGNGGERPVGIAAGRVAAQLHDFDAAARIAGMLLDSSDPQQWTPIVGILRAELSFASGRYAEAVRDLQLAAPFEPYWPLEMRALFALPDFVPATHEELAATLAAIDSLDFDARTPNTNFILAVHALAHRPICAYLQGMLAVRLGDVDRAKAHLVRLRSGQRTSPDTDPLRRALGESLDAHIVLASSDTTAALRKLQAIELDATIEQAGISPFYSRAYDRLVLADLLRATGQYDAAVPVYQSLIEGYDLLFVAPAHYRLAGLYARSGPPDSAQAHVKKFERLWRGADPALRARLTGATIP